MARVPTVGAKKLHIVQVGKGVRRIESRRARRAARREYAPELHADRHAIGLVNHEYGNEVASAKGATHAVESDLATALRGLRGMGLTGTALRQAQEEFVSRRADAASSLPSLLAGSLEDRNKALMQARQSLLEDRANMQQAAASKFNERLKELRTAGASALKEQEKHAHPKVEKEKFDPVKLKAAQIALETFLSNWAKNVKVKDAEGNEVPIQKANPLKTRDQWLEVIEGMVHHADGFGSPEALFVVNRFRRNTKHLAESAAGKF